MKIQLKRSNVIENAQAKKPTAEQTEFGELCVNYNFVDPALFIKDSNGNIIRIAGKDAFGQAVSSVNGQGGDVNLDYTDVGAASAAQGLLANTALQSGDNISKLVNNTGFITAADIPASPIVTVNGKTGAVVLNADDVGALSGGEDLSIFNNDVGYITSADLPAPPTIPVTSVNGETGNVVLDFNDVGAASASQGVLANSALQPGANISGLNNDAGYITGADIPGSPVVSVNGKTGIIVLDAEDLGALSPGDNITRLTNNAGFITSADIPAAPVTSVNLKTGNVSLSATDVGALAFGDNISNLNNDVGFVTASSIPEVPVNSVNGYQGNVILDAADTGAIPVGGNISSLFNDVGYITDADIPGSPVISVNSYTGIIELDASDVNAIALGANISNLNNDIGYLTAATLPESPVLSVNSKTGNVLLNPDDIGAATAAQGLRADSALQTNDNISNLINDVGYITDADIPGSPVLSVNSKTGNVSLNADDVGAARLTDIGSGTITITQPGNPNQSFNVNQVGGTVISLRNDNTESVSSVNGKTGDVTLSYPDVNAASEAQGQLAKTAIQPNDDISELNNDAGYITSADIPSIPTVGNGTITITQPGNTNQTFSVNQSGGTTINLRNDNTSDVNSVNGKTGTVTLNTSDIGAATSAQGFKADSALQPNDDISELNNDVGYITSAQIPSIIGGDGISTSGNTVNISLGDSTAGGSGLLFNNSDKLIVAPATTSKIGGVIVGNGLNVASNGVLDAAVRSVNNKTGAVNISTSDIGAATSAQGALADSALQPGDNITSLNNNAGFITSSSIPSVGNGTITIVQPGTTNQTFTVNQSGNKTITLKNDNTSAVTKVNNKTGNVVLNADDVGALEAGDNISLLNNNSGYLTSSTIPLNNATGGSGITTSISNKTLNIAVDLASSSGAGSGLQFNGSSKLETRVAAETIRGSVKIGEGIAVTSSGTISIQEQGTWTPELELFDTTKIVDGITVDATPTVTTQTGTYTRIGDICIASIDIRYDEAVGSNAVQITLPLTANSDPGQTSSVQLF